MNSTEHRRSSSPASSVAPRAYPRHAPRPDQLLRFRDARARAQRILEEVAKELFVGITERTTARLMTERLHAAGATGYLVEPRALFGERSTLPHRSEREDPRPGWSTLDQTEVYLLEAVPLLGGLPAPVALCGGAVGRPPGLGTGLSLLEEVRALIPREVADGGTCRSVARAVRALGKRRGWRDTTAPKPGWTLARRLERLPAALAPPGAPFGAGGLERARVGGFGLRRLAPAGKRLSPVWSDDPGAETPIAAGLWMLAPRFARGPVGVLQRDLLWVDADGPRWLEDGPLPRG